MTDDRTPLSERWGGWYVTGTTGSQTHLGNNTNLVDPVRSGGPSTEPTQNLTSLTGMFDTSKYLEPTSDVVALMTLEHQIRMTNLMIRIGWDSRMGMAADKLNPEIEEMLKYMLFADEAPLNEPVKGVSTFTETFPQARPPRSPRPLPARFRSEDAAVPLSAFLHDLQRRFRRDAGQGSRPCVPAVIRNPHAARTPARRSRICRRKPAVRFWRSSAPPSQTSPTSWRL